MIPAKKEKIGFFLMKCFRVYQLLSKASHMAGNQHKMNPMFCFGIFYLIAFLFMCFDFHFCLGFYFGFGLRERKNMKLDRWGRRGSRRF